MKMKMNTVLFRQFIGTTSTSTSLNPNWLFHFHTISTTHSSNHKPLSRLGFENVSNLDHGLSKFDQMVRMRPLPSIIDFTQLLGLMTRMKHYSDVVSLFMKMRARGIRVDEYTMNIVINCYCHLNRVDLGFPILCLLFKCGHVPDVVTFSTLLKGLFSENKITEAVLLFKKVTRETEIEPSEIMYGTIVNRLCKAGNTSTAIEILRLMENGSCKPNIVVYSTIIDSLCKDRMVNGAFNLFYEMRGKEILPNVVTYSSLIHGLCNFGHRKEATRLLNEMVGLKINPDVCTYSILVDSLCKEGMVSEAKVVVETMIQKDEEPNVITYTTLIDGYCLQGEMDEAFNLFSSMVGRGLVPDNLTYNILVNGYCKVNNVDEAMDLFQEMPRKGLEPSTDTYKTIMQGLKSSLR